MPTGSILVAGAEAPTRRSLVARLEADGFDVREAETGRAALADAPAADLVILDARLADGDGMVTLHRILEQDEQAVVVMMTPDADVTSAAIEAGAYAVARAPLDLDEIASTAIRAIEMQNLRRDVRLCRADAAAGYSLRSIVGSSAAVTALRHVVARAAAGPPSPVLLSGETGTGKSLVARVLHYSSDRGLGPFMHVSCAGPTEAWLEGELFGRDPAAYGGRAGRREPGRFEAARDGTIFLDDIAALTPALQARLLGVLKQGRIARPGASDIRVNARVIAATNRQLDDEVAANRFDAALFQSLSGAWIAVPPLRSHAEDIPLLVEHFVDECNAELRKRVLGATAAAYTLLQRGDWPGNVRELRLVVERAMLRAKTDQLEAKDFALASEVNEAADFELPAAGVDLEQLERSLLVQALRRSGGNQTRTGALLGLNRDQIRYRIEKFGLSTAP